MPLLTPETLHADAKAAFRAAVGARQGSSALGKDMLSKVEAATALHGLGLMVEAVPGWEKVADSATINLKAFLRLAQDASQRTPSSRQEIEAAVATFDFAHSGEVTREQLSYVIHKEGLPLGITERQVQQLLTEFDYDGSGRIGTNELVGMLTNHEA
eukprot:m.491302 g.491302  ORF g.491302 m.491302 type:complete len:157 (+) comp29596_c0_seq1:87-557(+)